MGSRTETLLRDCVRKLDRASRWSKNGMGVCLLKRAKCYMIGERVGTNTETRAVILLCEEEVKEGISKQERVVELSLRHKTCQ